MSHQNSSELFNTVVNGGYCVGCGACSVIEGSPIKIQLDKYAQLVATSQSAIAPDIDKKIQAVCPFSNKSKNEDTLGEELFGSDAQKHDKLGYFVDTYAGYVKEGDFRANGSSGGMGSWIVCELLKRELVDGVIHVQQHNPTSENPKLFQYQLSTTFESIKNGAKSRYYPIELSSVVQLIRSRPGKYAIVGLPCFIKSIRLLSQQFPELKERIVFCVGLVCGHLKSAHFASMWAWQNGIHPNQLKVIDFRTKLPAHAANEYGVTVSGEINGQLETKVSPPLSQLYGADWGWGLFKYKACDYCDDVVAETADITIGDAWLPQYLDESQGTNVIVVRNKEIASILADAQEKGQIHLDHVSAADVAYSQRGGFSHRREGLSYRLSLTDSKNEWRPQKRVAPVQNKVDKAMLLKQSLRVEIAAKSHVCFQNALISNDFNVFKEELSPLISSYEKLYKKSLWERGVRKLFRIFRKLLRR